MKRKVRRWIRYSIEQIKENAKNVNSLSVWANGYSADTTDKLAGRIYQITFTDGSSRKYQFLDGERLLWCDGVSEQEEAYRAAYAPGCSHTFVVQHFQTGGELPAGVALILNDKNGCVTFIDMKVGLPQNPREVTRKICFGHIKGIATPEDEEHSFTLDLVGKAILWKKEHDERPLFKQMYIAPEFYNYVHEYPESNECWMTTNPALYVRLGKGLYLISALKERQTGAHLLSLINTDKMLERELEFGFIGDDQLSGDDFFRMTLQAERTGCWTTIDSLV